MYVRLSGQGLETRAGAVVRCKTHLIHYHKKEEQTMSEFPIHTIESSPEASQPLLAGAQKKYGFVPNLMGVMATAPATLKSYLTLAGTLSETSFTPVEEQVIALTVSRVNACTYCMGAHSGIAKMVGMSDENLEALRGGSVLPDARLQAIATFTETVVTKRGWATEADQEEFVAAGFSQQQILEVLVGVAMKTLSNYTNHLADTPLDPQFAAFAWSPPVAADSTVSDLS